MSASRVTVAAVIPHWNQRALLETLFASLRAQTRPFDEVIVADNGSSDGSGEFAEREGARVLRLGRNLGFAPAVNRGIQATQADWVAILNNDVTLAPDWLSVLLAALESPEYEPEYKNVWFATGKILSAANPSVLDGSFDEVSRGACACRCGSGKPDSAFWNQSRYIRMAPMTAALFRRGLFEEIGLLDEAFESYLEDVDFGLRCALARHGGIYIPGAICRHRGSATMGQWNKDTVRRISFNQILLAAKHFRGQPLWPIVAGQLLWGLVTFRHARVWPYLVGKLSGFKKARAAASRNAWVAPDPQEFRAVIEASEKEIFEIERQTGFSTYWRAYFWLLRR
jgi:GT2 family glycosyltransferase